MRLTILAVALFASRALASDACHFNTPNTIVCTDPQNAATAFYNYGKNIALTNQSYNRALLQQAGCGRAYGSRYATVHVELIKRGRVALPTGWVGVSVVSVDGKDLYYVASDYISGECERYKPK